MKCDELSNPSLQDLQETFSMGSGVCSLPQMEWRSENSFWGFEEERETWGDMRADSPGK